MGENISRRRRRSWEGVYTVRSMTAMPGEVQRDLNSGGRIILPPSALAELMLRQVETPMLFKLVNPGTEHFTHAGVLEFTADEPFCFMPDWMMKNIGIEDGHALGVESIVLRSAEFAQFQPQSPEFLDITDPKAILENRLRNFTCLTTGDIIGIYYNNHLYEVKVLVTRPDNAVCVIECDLNTDFAAPVGYVDPAVKVPAEIPLTADESITGFVAFTGAGNRIDGKGIGEPGGSSTALHRVRGIPDFNYVPGQIEFFRNARFVHPEEHSDAEVFVAFQGAGQSLRPPPPVAAPPAANADSTLKAKRSRTDTSEA